MDFGKLMQDIQKEGKEYAASKLPRGEWYHVTQLEVVPSIFGGQCIKAHLDIGDRVFLPPKISKGLLPYASLLKKEDMWAIRFIGYKGEVVSSSTNLNSGSASNFSVPMFEMEKKKVLVLDNIVLPTPYCLMEEARVIEKSDFGEGSSGSGMVVQGGSELTPEEEWGKKNVTEIKAKKVSRGGRGKTGKRGSDEKKDEMEANKRAKLEEKIKEKELHHENQITFISDDEGNVHFVPDMF